MQDISSRKSALTQIFCCIQASQLSFRGAPQTVQGFYARHKQSKNCTHSDSLHPSVSAELQGSHSDPSTAPPLHYAAARCQAGSRGSAERSICGYVVLFRHTSTECWRGTYTWPTIQEKTLPKNSAKKLKREKAA
jgi:hypothetical protein